MKYKVIGWTSYDENENIPYSEKTINFAERNAIIDEIRKHQYLFSGWHHQESFENSIPILNDGKKRMFSQRGWGGVMASAYGYTDDYSYAIFTFQESINSRALKFPKKCFDIKDFKSEIIENEHFEVDVCEELFNIAKKKNPFYLEDEESLRSIEKNDTITLKCNSESLTFFVDDVNRNKKEIKFSKSYLIKGKYKVIIKHKPFAKVWPKKPLIILEEEANNLFKKCARKYEFNTLLELFSSYEISIVVKNSKSKTTISTLKQFVREYTDYAFDGSLVNSILYYLNDYEFSKEIAYKVLDYNSHILVCFVNYFANKGFNIDEHIPVLLKHYKDEDLYIEKILLRAIELNPNKKSLLKRYYKVVKDKNYNGFILYMGINEYNSLIKEHKQLIELDDFNKISVRNIFNIAQLMSYPYYDVTKDEYYPYSGPSFYQNHLKCIEKGIFKYQEYVNEKYNLANRLEELYLIGIEKKCKNIEKYYDEYSKTAAYVYALDALSGFNYNLKEKVIIKYKDKHSKLIKCLNKIYLK